MMGNGYGGDGGWMWLFGGLMMLGVIVLIGVAIWAIISASNRAHRGPAAPDAPATPDNGSRVRTRQILDERYARGEMTTDEYTHRLQTLGL